MEKNIETALTKIMKEPFLLINITILNEYVLNITFLIF